MTDKYSLVKNPVGYYEISPKPSIEELKEHYAKKYYQENKGDYKKAYSEDELTYFGVEAELALRTVKRFSKCPRKSLLDLGCGEGFFASHLKAKGWSVACVDFSDDGIKRHNPSLLADFVQADLITYLDTQRAELRFDFVNLDNVLEHVLDPVELLRKIRGIVGSDSVVRIEVPNDFSRFQSLLLERNCTENTWVGPPEHLSYFNKDSLTSLFRNEGFTLMSLQADFPIEQFLLNDHSNYARDKSLGKQAHLSRVIVTNYLAETNIERMIDYQEAAADLEFGRLLTAYITVDE